MQIALKDIDASPKHNSRSQLTGIDELAESLRIHGQRQSIAVYPAAKEGKYVVDAGFRRYAAAKQLGWESIECLVVAPPKNATITNLVENISREDLTSYDYAMALKKLKEDGLSARVISNQLRSSRVDANGTSTANINNLIRIATNLDPRILKAWKDGHEMATTYNLFQIVKQEDQWHAWQIMIGAIQTDVETDSESESPEESETEPKPRKRTPAQIAKLLSIMEQSQTIEPSELALCRQAFQWVLGNRPDVLGYALD